MRKSFPIVAGLLLLTASHGPAYADTALGAVFGYPGNVGLSLRIDHMPINAAWSDDFFHGTVDWWFIKQSLGDDRRLSWYFGPGIDAGIPLNDNEDFFLAGRAPFGLMFMLAPRIETFGELAPGIQVLNETDFYWAGNVGVRFVLGGRK